MKKVYVGMILILLLTSFYLLPPIVGPVSVYHKRKKYRRIALHIMPRLLFGAEACFLQKVHSFGFFILGQKIVYFLQERFMYIIDVYIY